MMSTKERLISIVAYGLSGAQVLADGLSSARQITDFFSGQWAKYASCTATVVEGEIYRKNIESGVKRLKLLSKKYLKEYLFRQALNEHLILATTSDELRKNIIKGWYALLGDLEKKYLLEDDWGEVKDEWSDYDFKEADEKEKKDLDNIRDSLSKQNFVEEEEANEIIENIQSFFDFFSKRRRFTLKYIDSKDRERFQALMKESRLYLALAAEPWKEKRIKEGFCAFLADIETFYSTVKEDSQREALLELKNSLQDANFFKSKKKAEENIDELKDFLSGKRCHSFFTPEHRVQLESLINASEVNAFLKFCLFTRCEEEPNFFNKLQSGKEISSTEGLVALEMTKAASERAKEIRGGIYLSLLFSLVVGACIGVITFYTFPTVLIGLGISSAVVVWGIWPLTILSAYSYALLIYNTSVDLILHETLSVWWKALKQKVEEKYKARKLGLLIYIGYAALKALKAIFNKFVYWAKKKKEEGLFSYGFRIILSFAVLVFGFMSALTTGYTSFVQLQNYISLALCILTALPIMVSDLLFTLKNSFETVSLLSGLARSSLGRLFLNRVKEFLCELKNELSKENCVQWGLSVLIRLPLKCVQSVLKLIIFMCHVFFSSVASDRLFNFPCWLTLFFAAGSELLTDISPLFGKNQGDDQENHDHDQGGLFNWIEKLLFILPATLLGILNGLFSQLNRFSSNEQLKPLIFWEAIKKEWQYFDIIQGYKAEISKEVEVSTKVNLKSADRTLRGARGLFFPQPANDAQLGCNVDSTSLRARFSHSN